MSDPQSLRSLTESLLEQESKLREGGGSAGRERQHRHGRRTVRQRLVLLLDEQKSFLELGLWAGYQMYPQWGEVPAAGVVTGIGKIHGRSCMVIANDAGVKAGAFFPQTVKKVLRAQKIASQCSLPIIYLVDSAGVFLPLQAEVFPDEEDFGRIFRNNAVLSASGIPQYAAIMGNCVAGGAYLPVLCDKLLMTEGSGLYLAGPALVKAAIGQQVDDEELGGAKMHAEISGTVDFLEPDEESCISRLRSLIALLASPFWGERSSKNPKLDPDTLYDLVSADGRREYDVRDLLAAVIDADSLEEYKAEFGKTLVTAYARIDGRAVGIVANQHLVQKTGRGELQLSGVIYAESADKAARFIMDCNQTGLPIVFFQDVQGFMIGKDAEQSGIIRSGAKLVNVVSNSLVPKITIIVGGSFGAGNYALCGKAFDPCFLFAWPSAKYAVMGAHQAADTILAIRKRTAEREGKPLADNELEELHQSIQREYESQTDIRYGAARGWVDSIIPPDMTREVLITSLGLATRKPPANDFRTGVLQV